ncbi:MAG TPA: DUF4199 domain-containing protein [Candidatus Elarobacter sp.]|nr:DUF4199 domain-containing protein [Candidatus Elarobacter sp.]
MKKTILTFGLISGAVAALTMQATLPFSDSIDSTRAYILGYTSIVLSLLLVFFGVRSYRENVNAGRLTFGRGFAIGILITLISSACYVARWELIYFKLKPDFGEKYAATMVKRVRESGANQQKIDEAVRQAHEFKRMYDKPAYNIGLTFMEIFPVGLVITLISAGILRKKAGNQQALEANG